MDPWGQATKTRMVAMFGNAVKIVEFVARGGGGAIVFQRSNFFQNTGRENSQITEQGGFGKVWPRERESQPSRTILSDLTPIPLSKKKRAVKKKQTHPYHTACARAHPIVIYGISRQRCLLHIDASLAAYNTLSPCRLEVTPAFELRSSGAMCYLPA